ncbi:MAG: pullulanase-type alpha-1,6-glucosidase [Balneolales bacterium]|nr:pullulanase-type alpha-1,6-glucosidase [Balneolales bacterium]
MCSTHFNLGNYLFPLVFFIFILSACSKESPEIENASAHWISSSQLLWYTQADADQFALIYSRNAELDLSAGNQNADGRILLSREGELDAETANKYRHIQDWPVFSLSAGSEEIYDAITGQLVAVALDASGNVIEATRVQFPGVIDELFAFEGMLGPIYDGNTLHLRLWAPTAQNVELVLYSNQKEEVSRVEADRFDASTGVWHFSGPVSEWDRAFYRFNMTVFHHENSQINTYEVTDPYSVSLSTDSYYSQFANIAGDPELKPDGWDSIRKQLPRPTDITLYEVHVRDFSALDESVEEQDRGTFMAFTYNGRNSRALSNGMAHLKALRDAGLTHIHLLPVFDITTVIENRENRIDIADPYSKICEEMANSEELKPYCERFGDMPIIEAFEQLAAENPVTKSIQLPYSLRGRYNSLAFMDGFNWGYDPFHFNAIEGSYSTDPEGVQRIIEFREMVKALHEIGFKVVVDVVYNHTSAHGLTRRSVLDRVVPGYYQRYDVFSGNIETSTCCPNTASEHFMMERLLIDSVVFWAKHYKIDSFRFDLMGHHSLETMKRLQDELELLTLEEHGVDGANIYIYGEGWNFGEVADNRIFDQATQFMTNGTGIGNFNDRKRDGIRGRNFTDSGRFQGFTSGQFLFPNEDAGDDADAQRRELLSQGDRIRVGLAGNMRAYRYQNSSGDIVTGFNDMIGFTDMPQETINYIDKHDNETLWDNTQTKLPLDMSTEDRVRVHMLSLAMINFGQGVPFHQMGSDILRSKSLDRNSFDSGDWFNRVDFTMQTHNWGKGLPPAWDNRDRWEQQEVFLKNELSLPAEEHMRLAHEIFKDQLRIRYSTGLLRLLDPEDVMKRVAFHNTGPDQVPGLIVMSVSDGRCAGRELDSRYNGLVIIFNAALESQNFSTGIEGLRLHHIQQNGADEIVKGTVVSSQGDVTIPALTAAVLVQPRQGRQGAFVCNEL